MLISSDGEEVWQGHTHEHDNNMGKSLKIAGNFLFD
jgi:hypothetical protein